MHGIGIAPTFMQATMATCHSGIRGSSTMTRSPRATPCRTSRFANWLLARAISEKLKRRSSPASLHQISAGLSWRAAWASTTSRPKLKVAGSSSVNARTVAA